MDLLNLYGRASEWTLTKVTGAADKLGASTPCDEWDVRTLMNHMLDTHNYFVGVARSQDVSPPAPDPPEIIGENPAADFADARTEAMSVFSGDGVIDQTGPALGIAFSDQLLHGWDLAKATGQDPIMPDGLAEAAYEIVHGRFTDDERSGVFGPEVAVPATASAQDTLLAYTGRDPSA
jgi:uncharacterized protein (TIGR03086 family)